MCILMLYIFPTSLVDGRSMKSVGDASFLPPPPVKHQFLPPFFFLLKFLPTLGYFQPGKYAELCE